MSGLLLLFWIIFVSFVIGVHMGRLLERKRSLSASDGLSFVLYSGCLVFMIEHAAKAGWLPNNPQVGANIGWLYLPVLVAMLYFIARLLRSRIPPPI